MEYEGRKIEDYVGRVTVEEDKSNSSELWQKDRSEKKKGAEGMGE